MNVMRTLGTLGIAALATVSLAACEAGTSSGPLATQPTGTVESQLRQQQLQNIQSGANPGVQNPVATSVGVGGIERQGVGAGSTAAGGVTGVNPGVGGIERQGVGAPPTPVRRPAGSR
jgi:hypothetical protein